MRSFAKFTLWSIFIATVFATVPFAHGQSASLADEAKSSANLHKLGSDAIRSGELSEPVKGRILTVFSYHPGLEWVQSLLAGFDSGLSTLPYIEHHTEFLDAKRHPKLEHSEAFLSSLRAKYEDAQPDVLMIADDPAFELLLDKLPELFPGVPVVFLGLNDVRENLPASFTGIYEIHEATPTLDIAMQLTKAAGVAVVSTSSVSGKAHEHSLEAAIEAYPDLEWVIIRDIVNDDLSALQELPDDWPILPLLELRQGSVNGPLVTHSRSVELIKEQVPNPMFWSTEFLMGRGIVGGYILRAEVHARQALDIAVRILNGADPSDIPAITDTPHEWRFDWRELERFGWLGQTPESAELLFMNPSFFDRHRELFAPIGIALLGFLGVIGTLIWHLRSEKRHATRLESETQRLATALLAADAGVFEIKADGTTLNSDRWLQMFESADVQTSSLEWVDQLTEKSSIMLKERFQLLRDGSSRENLEIQLESPQRLIHLMLMRDGEDEPERAGIVGIGTDVTNRRRVEQQAEARSRLNSLGQLAGGVAHDFNNLLMVIIGNAEMIPTVDTAEKKNTLANMIVSVGGKAEALTQRLLAFGRVEQPEELSEVDLNQHVGSLQDLLNDMAKGCDVSIQLSDFKLLCLVSPPSLDQILTNLVVNAGDAMAGQGTIIVETGKSENEKGEPLAVLCVRDVGEGMSKETTERLFEPFFSTKGAGRGNGLGLSIVYGLVSSSGGTISVNSIEGKGSTFEVSWPLLDAGAA